MNDDDVRAAAARMTAEMDQAQQATRQIAETMTAYFQTLTAGGLERAEALQLTVGYQGLFVGNLIGLFGAQQGDE